MHLMHVHVACRIASIHITTLFIWQPIERLASRSCAVLRSTLALVMASIQCTTVHDILEHSLDDSTTPAGALRPHCIESCKL